LVEKPGGMQYGKKDGMKVEGPIWEKMGYEWKGRE
jgi:hypothetical protein